MPASAKRTQLPADFMASPAVCEWCRSKYGSAELAGVACLAFVRYHQEQRIDQGRPALYLNWQRALQTFIRLASPAGRYYSSREWGSWLAAAQRAQGATARSSPGRAWTPEGERQTVDSFRTIGELVRQAAPAAPGREQSETVTNLPPEPERPRAPCALSEAAASGLVAARAALGIRRPAGRRG